MCTDFSYRQSISGTLLYALTLERNRVINDEKDVCRECCPSPIVTGLYKCGYGLGIAMFFALNVVEALAKLFFALITLPVVLFEDGKEFYKKVSMQSMINSFDSLTWMAYAFFANIYENRISRYSLNDRILSF